MILERCHAALGALSLSDADALLEAHLEQAVQAQKTYADFLCELLEAEVSARSVRALQSRMRLAGFPYAKTLEQFDFAFQPSLDERQVRELSTLRFVQEGS